MQADAGQKLILLACWCPGHQARYEGQREGRSLRLRDGRFPVTRYKEQWLRLLAMAEDIKAFIEANNDNLKSKE
jgi:hypothetical protein